MYAIDNMKSMDAIQNPQAYYQPVSSMWVKEHIQTMYISTALRKTNRAVTSPCLTAGANSQMSRERCFARSREILMIESEESRPVDFQSRSGTPFESLAKLDNDIYGSTRCASFRMPPRTGHKKPIQWKWYTVWHTSPLQLLLPRTLHRAS